MKKIILSILPLLWFCGCADSDSNMPVMKIVGIHIVGDEEEVNYANNLHQMPSLAKGDKVDIGIELYGNGNDLRSFIVQNEEDKVKTVLFFQIDEVSQELSDINELVFNDGITETSLAVKAEILKDEDGEQKISFFLNSKAIDSEGAHIDLVLKTQLLESPQ